MYNDCYGFQYQGTTARGNGSLFQIGNRLQTLGFNDYHEEDIIILIELELGISTQNELILLIK